MNRKKNKNECLKCNTLQTLDLSHFVGTFLKMSKKKNVVNLVK